MSYIGSIIYNKDFYNSSNSSINKNLQPFIGPRPFYRTFEDQKKFFGRDEEANEIVSIISTHKLILIYAQSGAGKTSLFNAQVIPILEDDGFEVLPVTRIKSSNIISSSSSALETLDTYGIKNLYILNALQNLKPDLNIYSLKDKPLSEFLEDYFPIKKDKYNNDIPQILIFDQFEEIFDIFPRNWKEQRKDFFNQVAKALKRIKSLQIVFIIREDFMAQLDPYRNVLPERLNPRFRLERLREDSALLAVKGPLEKIPKNYLKFSIEDIDDDIRNIINELMKIQVEYFPGHTYQVEGEFIEPIQLQVVFKTWWEKMIYFDPKNPHQNLIDVSDVDNALEKYYEEAISEVIKRTNINESEIRKWCEENLITSAGTRNIVHRSIQSTAGIKNEVIDILEEKYLIKENWRAGSRWYELAHDRLVKPLTSSNQKWKYEQNIKKKSKIKKITIPTVILSIIVIVYISLWYNGQYFIPPIESISAGDLPYIVSVNPNTGLVYVTNPKSDIISIIDGKRNDIISFVSVPDEPTDITVDSKNNLVYVTHPYKDIISVMEGSSGKIIKLIDFKSPLSLALNSDSSKMYVTSTFSNSVSIINTHTNKILNNITVGKYPTALSVDSKNNLVYVANYEDDTISVVNENNLTAKPIKVGKSPISIAINYNKNKIYVSNSGNDTITVIDQKDYKKLKTIKVGKSPISIAINYNNNKIYVANSEDDTISVIDGNLDIVVAILDVGIKPSSIDINPQENLLYVSNNLDHKITAIDIDYNLPHDVLSKIPVGIHPTGIAIDNMNQEIYVANTDSNNVSVIDGKTKMVKEVYEVGKKPTDVSLNTKYHKLYISNSMSNTVSIIDLNTNNQTDNPVNTTGTYPTGLAVDETHNLVYVANSKSNSVSVIDGKTGKVNSTIEVRNEPRAITVDSQYNYVYVANYGNDSVSVIDGKTGKVNSTIEVGIDPIAITVDSQNNYVYVANYGNDSLSIIDGTTQKLIKGTIPIGQNNFRDGPIAITVDSKNNLVYVINNFSDNLSVIDIKFIKDSIRSAGMIKIDPRYKYITTNLYAGKSPTDVSFNALTNQIYVTNTSENMINIVIPFISK